MSGWGRVARRCARTRPAGGPEAPAVADRVPVRAPSAVRPPRPDPTVPYASAGRCGPWEISVIDRAECRTAREGSVSNCGASVPIGGLVISAASRARRPGHPDVADGRAHSDSARRVRNRAASTSRFPAATSAIRGPVAVFAAGGAYASRRERPDPRRPDPRGAPPQTRRSEPAAGVPRRRRGAPDRHAAVPSADRRFRPVSARAQLADAAGVRLRGDRPRRRVRTAGARPVSYTHLTLPTTSRV